jgi:hypothetical protein
MLGEIMRRAENIQDELASLSQLNKMKSVGGFSSEGLMKYSPL